MIYQYVIYDHPADFPDHWVVRRWAIGRGTLVPDPEPLGVANTLEAARWLLPEGLMLMPNPGETEPTIVEVWM